MIGTATRIVPGSEAPVNRRDVAVRIFRSEDECAGKIEESAESEFCPPWVDRAAGQVRVSFQLQVDGAPIDAALGVDTVEFFHKEQPVTAGDGMRVAIIPHQPAQSPRLFILLIDVSGSMAQADRADGRTRMELVRDALLRRDVVDAFFGTHARNAVVPLVFSGAGDPVPLGGVWVVDNPETYSALIREKLGVGAGYTFLYRAIEFATSKLLDNNAVGSAMTARDAQPVVIALTDGFNNERPEDTCAANAPRLGALLRGIDTVRHGASRDYGRTPVVYTVGLGVGAWRDVPARDEIEVTAATLCPRRESRRIDGDLEREGVDNAALTRIARVGGGAAFIRRDSNGLAEAFKAAAATRYRWFEARYQVDPFHLRRSWETRLRLDAMGRPADAVRFEPSGWFDGPRGVPDADGWTHPPPRGSNAALVLPILAALIGIAWLPAAVVNLMRVLSGRVRGRW